MAQQLRYEELPTPTSIRLVELPLRRSAEDGLICAKLRVLDLEDAARPRYKCLSYTWGCPWLQSADLSWSTKTKSIKIELGDADGQGGTLDATMNLAAFLEALALEPMEADGPQYIWIDSICINQRDLSERGAQVKIMDDIYEFCDEVIIWLGPEDDDANVTFDMLDIISQIDREGARKRFFELLKSVKDDTLSFYERKASAYGLSWPRSYWLAYSRFLERAWFHRVWTIQEMLLPNKHSLRCGSRRSGLGELTFCNDFFRSWFDDQDDSETLWNSHPDGVSTMGTQAMWSLQLTLTHRLKTLQELRSFNKYSWTQGKGCSEIRDIIYGQLGFLDRSVVSRLPVDYNLPVDELCIRFAIATGMTTRDGLIAASHYRPGCIRNLPSWVLDLSAAETSAVLWTRLGGNSIHSAGGSGECVTRVLEPECRILQVRGFQVDTIGAVGGAFASIKTGHCFVKSLHVLDQLLRDHPRQAGADPIEEFWRTLVANLFKNSGRHPFTDVCGPGFRALLVHYLAKYVARPDVSHVEIFHVQDLLNSLHAKSNSKWLPSWDEVQTASQALEEEAQDGLSPIPKATKSYVYTLKEMFADRQFFTTRGGRMGIGPMTLGFGSKIFVLEGCQYPFVLEDGQQGRFRLAAHVYLSGVMHGEALSEDCFQTIELE